MRRFASVEVGGGTLAVALVDDDEVSRTITRELFEKTGRFRVVAEAVDGREAVERLRDARPDAVILDLAMPDVSGMEVLPLLREAAPGAAVVVYSALSADRLSHVIDTGEADAVVSKGAPPSTLHDQVEASVRRLHGGDGT